MDFHEFQAREQENTSMELASEFGLTMREVKQLKKQLERSWIFQTKYWQFEFRYVRYDITLHTKIIRDGEE